MYGEILSNLRKNNGYTQEQVASYLHISKSTVSNYENSLHFPPYDILLKLCDLYKVSADYILGRTQCRMNIDRLNVKLPGGYTVGICLELILTSDMEHKSHLIKYLELTQPRIKDMKKRI